MEYTVHALARLAGLSDRTLRYYDAIGLLTPARIGENGYRYYGPAEVDRLQQILFYRALSLPLETIKAILAADDYDRQAALEQHLEVLRTQQTSLASLIQTVEKTIRSLKGETSMTDEEKFEGLKQQWLRENETRYGAQLRSQFGDALVDAANEKYAALTPAQLQNRQALEEEILARLALLVPQGKPESEQAMQLCHLHEQWLRMYWPEGSYSRTAHRELGETYVSDERFRSYYDRHVPGAATYLRDALRLYCGQ